MEFGLSLGSNLGDRLANLKEARRRIGELIAVRVTAQSAIYETEPVGVKPEHRPLKFLNAVLILESDRTPAGLHAELAAIENALGRVRGQDRYAPRALDIDILFAGDQLYEKAGLTIPHPCWAERRFVAQPLADVRPDLVLPGAKKSVADILARLPKKPAVKILVKNW